MRQHNPVELDASDWIHFGMRDKSEIHQRFIHQLREELASITAAAKHSIELATSEEHQAESKYDTFSLESSYLARGQAKRVEELQEALERLELLPLKELGEADPIQLSALVRLEANDGEVRTLFFGPAGGGEELTVDGEEVIIVTSSSPLGQAVLGKRVGDAFELKMGIDAQTFTIASVQ